MPLTLEAGLLLLGQAVDVGAAAWLNGQTGDGPPLDRICGSGYALPYTSDQPGPQRVRFGIENEIRVAGKDVPEASADFIFQLPRAPAAVSKVHAELAWIGPPQ